MAEKKLPTGVGKKIVEALKKQDDLDLELNNTNASIVEEEETVTISSADNANMSLDNMDEQISSYENLITDEVNDGDLNQIEEYTPEPTEQQIYQQPQVQQAHQQPQQNIYAPEYAAQGQNNFSQYQEQNFNTNPVNNYREENVSYDNEPKTFDMPSNVAVLKKLIAQLPNGVTKQTGAQIIRQTMEALGISMNSVLSEAQHMQDGLNDSIRDCMTTVNEYKQNIMTLEKQVVDYQRQVKSVNDLISLFLLTDNK